MIMPNALARSIVPLLVAICLVSATAHAQYAGGSGTRADPYQIATAEQLISVGRDPGLQFSHFVLIDDIDLDPNLPGGQVFRQAVIPKFYGTFDGNGHAILNLTISGGSGTGLFGELKADAFFKAASSVRDLRLVDADVSSEGRNVGILAGSSSATIVGCHTSGTARGGEWVGGLVGINYRQIRESSSAAAVHGERNVGGLVGQNSEDIAHCNSTGTVCGDEDVGGLVGANFESVIDCYSTGLVSGGTRGASLGGLLGINFGRVANCHSTGSVTGAGQIGGLVGTNFSGIIVHCFSDGAVEGNVEAGGLVGANLGSVVNSDATGTVSGGLGVGGLVGTSDEVVAGCSASGAVSGQEGVGGLIGGNDGLVHNCFSTGNVSGSSTVGGLAGANLAEVTNCYSTGRITAGSPVGGLVATNSGCVEHSFWDVQTSGKAQSAGGMGRPTDQMQDVSLFLAAQWDFVDEARGAWGAWRMPHDGGYPLLCWNSRCTCPELSGQGTAEDPYRIASSAGLGAVVCDPTASYQLTASIDLSDIVWHHAVIPVFAGTFDGYGHTIRGLTISGRHHLGLFGALVEGATVRDLGLADVNVAGTNYIGALAAENLGTVERCFSRGSVSSNAETSYESCIGGLVARSMFGSLTDCYSDGTVTGIQDVGGLAGHGSRITNCYSSCVVSGQEYLGGLTSYGGNWWCNDSFWDAEVSGQTKSSAGKGLDTATMQSAQTYLEAGWDFMGETRNGTKDIWWIDDGQDYPRLWWELP